MSIRTARTCAFSSRSAISRHSAARSLHSLEVIIGYSPNRTHQSITRTVGLLDFVQPPSPSGRLRGWAGQAGLAEVPRLRVGSGGLRQGIRICYLVFS